MDFDSSDVEKDFPGLYAAEGADRKSRKSKEDDNDYNDGEQDKVSKKDLLIGRRKDKKDKGKDLAVCGVGRRSSSPEEELETKSQLKSKTFTTSKSKEKREKLRDKEKNYKEPPKDDEKSHKAKDKPDKEKDTIQYAPQQYHKQKLKTYSREVGDRQEALRNIPD